MFRQLPKILIIALVTLAANSMPHLFAKDINGFVPSDEIVSRHLGVDSAGSPSQVSSVDFSNDLTSSELGKQQRSNVGGQEKDDAYNEKSGKVLGEVSKKAIENGNPIISCSDPKANCDLTPTPTSIPSPPNTPTVVPGPAESPKLTPTVKPIPTPAITVIPLPSKFPTLYPCPPLPIEGISTTEAVVPCID